MCPDVIDFSRGKSEDCKLFLKPSGKNVKRLDYYRTIHCEGGIDVLLAGLE